MDRRIVGFHQDAELNWVAELDCGHRQHVRHDPPWQNRPWVLTPAGRRDRIGTLLPCPLCDEPASAAVAADAPIGAYEDARLRGLCHDGAAEVNRPARVAPSFGVDSR